MERARRLARSVISLGVDAGRGFEKVPGFREMTSAQRSRSCAERETISAAHELLVVIQDAAKQVGTASSRTARPALERRNRAFDCRNRRGSAPTTARTNSPMRGRLYSSGTLNRLAREDCGEETMSRTLRANRPTVSSPPPASSPRCDRSCRTSACKPTARRTKPDEMVSRGLGTERQRDRPGADCRAEPLDDHRGEGRVRMRVLPGDGCKFSRNRRLDQCAGLTHERDQEAVGAWPKILVGGRPYVAACRQYR